MKKIYQCRDCKNDFSWDSAGRAGRPPIRCPACREVHQKIKHKQLVAVKEKLTPLERVENLELLLKSRNAHISQHRDKYE